MASFAAHLGRLNARRLGAASWYFALVVALLLAVNVALPALRLWPHAIAQAVVLGYFAILGLVCRSPPAARWPAAALPLAFGLPMMAAALVFTWDLAPRLGANPAYATGLFVACLAPVWPPRLLLAVLVPVHLLYLAMVFAGGQPAPFALLMTVGGTIAAALGWFVARLQHRTERHAFETAATIGRQKDALAEALARVERLLAERGEMVATVAHDLQSPLAGIRALLRTIPERADGDGPKLREIARTCGDMQDAIARLLEAHAAESDAAERGPVDLEALFAAVGAAHAAVAAGKGIALAHDAAGLAVLAEPQLLARALGNLLSNAIKFSPPGSAVRIEARRSGARVRLSVIDRGPGIAAGEVEALFGKFRPLSARPTAGEPTSGLGLYIVQGIARRLGATVGYEPNPQGGSVFFLELEPAASVTPSRP
jgi:signal transduction histidine kinase